MGEKSSELQRPSRKIRTVATAALLLSMAAPLAACKKQIKGYAENPVVAQGNNGPYIATADSPIKLDCIDNVVIDRSGRGKPAKNGMPRRIVFEVKKGIKFGAVILVQWGTQYTAAEGVRTPPPFIGQSYMWVGHYNTDEADTTLFGGGDGQLPADWQDRLNDHYAESPIGVMITSAESTLNPLNRAAIVYMSPALSNTEAPAEGNAPKVIYDLGSLIVECVDAHNRVPDRPAPAAALAEVPEDQIKVIQVPSSIAPVHESPPANM